MRREFVTWGVVLGAIILAFVGTVLTLNATLYSAGGFVGAYLDALHRRDATAALELVGPTTATGDASDQLLIPDAMGELTDIELLSDVEREGGVHRVTYGYVAEGVPAESTFEVRSDGATFGLFPTWTFVTTPISVLQVTPEHDARFTANGVPLLAPAQDVATPYLVFAPGTYVLDHESTYLRANAVPVTVSEPGTAVPGSIDVKPNEAFVAQVQKEIDEDLGERCAAQEVLLPTGCPFGQVIDNRIISSPQWSISTYPQVTLQPGPEPASWLMPRTPAAAHLVVEVRSLFDGSVSLFDEDVPFTASYLVTFLPNDELLITAQY